MEITKSQVDVGATRRVAPTGQTPWPAVTLRQGRQIPIFKQKEEGLFGYLNLRFEICLVLVSWLLGIS